MHIYVEESVVYKYEKIAVDILSAGQCRVVQRVKLARKPEAVMPDVKTFRLFGSGRLPEGLEIGVAARDALSGEGIAAAAAIEREGGCAVVATIAVRGLLARYESPEIEIEYSNLPADFCLAGFPRSAEWAVKPDTQTHHLEAEIKLPAGLLAGRRLSARCVPEDWATTETCEENGRACISIRGGDLKIAILYRVIIEGA
ncbi:MAG: hypothetical protein ACT4NX_05890 [Deltaproteobacteria bacterium]